MSSPERKAWRIFRSLDVDYVFVLFGGFIGCAAESSPSATRAVPTQALSMRRAQQCWKHTRTAPQRLLRRVGLACQCLLGIACALRRCGSVKWQ